MPGARCTRGLVCKLHKKMRTRAYRFSGGIRHSLRNGFTTYIVLSPADRACCHRHRRDTSRQLDASIGASGPHDFAVRVSTVRQRRLHVHRIPSRAYDDRETPLVPGRDQIDILLIWVRRQVNFGKSEIDRGLRRHGVSSEKCHWRTSVQQLIAIRPSGVPLAEMTPACGPDLRRRRRAERAILRSACARRHPASAPTRCDSPRSQGRTAASFGRSARGCAERRDLRD